MFSQLMHWGAISYPAFLQRPARCTQEPSTPFSPSVLFPLLLTVASKTNYPCSSSDKPGKTGGHVRHPAADCFHKYWGIAGFNVCGQSWMFQLGILPSHAGKKTLGWPQCWNTLPSASLLTRFISCARQPTVISHILCWKAGFGGLGPLFNLPNSVAKKHNFWAQNTFV